MESPEALADRTCIVTRQQKPEAELIRFVLSPDGVVTPDLKRKLPGRGCWVTKSRAAVAEAVKRKAFGHALDEKAKAEVELPDLVARLMRQEMVQALSLCRKAGLAVSGFTKVEDAASKGHIMALIHARGASADGLRKLARYCDPKVAILDLFDTPELDLAFGRENVVHAALNAGGQTVKLLDLAQGLAQYENVKIESLNELA